MLDRDTIQTRLCENRLCSLIVMPACLSRGPVINRDRRLNEFSVKDGNNNIKIS